VLIAKMGKTLVL